MIKTFIKDGKTYASIEALFRWERNPKLVLREDFDRLKKYISKFGQFKPLVVMPNGEVIGGNSRLEVMKDLKVKEVWVSIVAPKSEAEKIELSLADNDEVGKYIEEDLAQLIGELGEGEINLKDVKVNVGGSIDLAALIDSLGPSEEFESDHDEHSKTVTCPECGHEFTP